MGDPFAEKDAKRAARPARLFGQITDRVIAWAHRVIPPEQRLTASIGSFRARLEYVRSEQKELEINRKWR